jgi:hypothetical protein
MLIREGDNFLEMIAAERIPDHLPTPGDTRFGIRVESFGFAGQGWMWVDLQSSDEIEIEQVSGDGADDKRKCYEAIGATGAKAVILPRQDAVLWEAAEAGAGHPRHQAIERIEEVGRKVSKQESNYHRRSLAGQRCIDSREFLIHQCGGDLT